MNKQIIPVLLVNPTRSLQNASGINVLLKHVLLVIHVAAHVHIFSSMKRVECVNSQHSIHSNKRSAGPDQHLPVIYIICNSAI